jgi:hypothetical protein
MKKCLFVFLVTMICQQGFSQQLSLMVATKETQDFKAINSDRAYTAIINTTFDKKNLISKTKDLFILEGLADSSQLKTVVYDENLSEYKIRFGFRQGQSKSKGMMGAAFVAPPVILYFDAIFSFNSLGQIKVSFTNFDSEVIASADENNFLNCYKGGKGNGKIVEPILPADRVIMDEYTAILMSGTGIGKALLWANGGLEMLNKNTRGEFRKKLNEQFDSYYNAIKQGSSVRITKDNIANYTPIGGMAKFWPDQIAKFKADKLVISVDNYRWLNYFELNFNYFFKEISNITSGKIDKIALDGNVTYENVDGKILPVDPKERKTWLNKSIEF